MLVLGGGTFGKRSGHEHGTIIIRLSVLIKETPRELSTLFNVRTLPEAGNLQEVFQQNLGMLAP